MRLRQWLPAIVCFIVAICTLTRIGIADERTLMLRALFNPANVSAFDPSQCQTSANGALYVALGRHVFKWPVDNLPMFEELKPPLDAIGGPIPPNPEEPRGCPGNPYPLEAIGVDLAADGTMLASTEANDAAVFAKILRLLPGQSWQPFVELHAEVFQSLCDGQPTMTSQGLMRCSSDKSTDPDRKSENQSQYITHFRASPDLYADPFGNAFYIRCPDHRPPQCQVDYALFDYVVLGYEFRPQQLSASKVVEFDRTLRTMVATAEVKDFVWH